MRIKEIIKREVEEEVTKELHCDNCKINIEWFDSCGFGQAFTLSDAWCSQEGGKTWEFCNFKCLKEFINNNKLDEPRKSNQKEQEGK